MDILISLFHICLTVLILLPFVVIAVVQKDKKEREKERDAYLRRQRWIKTYFDRKGQGNKHHGMGRLHR